MGLRLQGKIKRYLEFQYKSQKAGMGFDREHFVDQLSQWLRFVLIEHLNGEVIARHPLERPLAEEVGVEVLDGSDGRVQVALRPALRNPEGIMQGALVALLAEVAAETLAEHSHGAPQTVTALDVRYLSGAREGPIEAHARWVGDAAEGMQRVTLRDRGNGDRITASVLAQTTRAVSP